MAGEKPETTYSINPAAWQWWLWLAGRMIAVVIGLWIGISFVASREFDQRLRQFHEVARPSIESFVVKEVQAHAALPAHGVVLQRLENQEKRDAVADEQLKTINEKINDINKKLDILLERD